MKNKEVETLKLRGEKESVMKEKDKIWTEKTQDKNTISDLKAEQVDLKTKLTEKERDLKMTENALGEERQALGKTKKKLKEETANHHSKELDIIELRKDLEESHELIRKLEENKQRSMKKLEDENNRLREIIAKKERKRKLNSDAEMPLRNPPQGGLPQSSRTNPPQSGLPLGSSNPPQGGLPLSSKRDQDQATGYTPGYGLGTGLSPLSTHSTPKGVPTYYSSTSDSEGGVKRYREDKDVFKIPKMTKRNKDDEKNKLIEDMKQTLRENKEMIEDFKKRGSRSSSPETAKAYRNLTEAQIEKIEKAKKEYKEVVLQAEKHYKEGDRQEHAHPKCVRTNLEKGHPTFTTLDLEWSLSGSWVGAPKRVTAFNREGEEIHNYSIARVEKYIDREGKEHKAMCYGTDSTTLMVWYDWEEIREFFKLWTPPETPKWANLKVWTDSARMEKQTIPPKNTGMNNPLPPPHKEEI